MVVTVIALGVFLINLNLKSHNNLGVCHSTTSCISRCRGKIAKHSTEKQEAQLSPSDRAMRLVSSNLANYHATVQKLLTRQVRTKPMV